MKLPQGKGPLSEINVTPLVDVFLVLLVIFMITAPVLRQAIEVNLPSARSSVTAGSEGMTIHVSKDGSVSIGGRPLAAADLPDYLKDWKAGLRGKTEPVYIRADEKSPYGDVIYVLDEVRAAGIVDVGMVTKRNTKSRNNTGRRNAGRIRP